MFWDMTANTTVLEKVHFRKNTVKVLSLSSPGFKYVIGIFTVSFIFPIVKLWRGLVLIYLRVRLASLQWVVKLSLSPSVKWLCWHQVSVLVCAHRLGRAQLCVPFAPEAQQVPQQLNMVTTYLWAAIACNGTTDEKCYRNAIITENVWTN